MKDQIDEYIDYLNKVKKTSSNTVVSYKRDLMRMAGYMADRGIIDAGDVTQDKIRDYVSSLMEESFAPSSITRHITSMKSFFRYMLENGNMEDNPAENLKSPKIEKKEVRVLSTMEIEELLSQKFSEDAKGKRDKAILELMYSTGLKTSEMVSLKLENIDLGLGCVRLPANKKNSKDRLIPYGKKAKEALSEYLIKAREEMLQGEEDSDILFLNCNGTRMSRQGLWKLIKTYVKKSGVKSDITPFTLRHSFATHLVENGADITSVQEMLGYCDSNTVSRYIKKQDKNKDPFEWARIRN